MTAQIGDPGVVDATAASLRHAEQVLLEASHAIRGFRAQAWRGTAAEAYEQTQSLTASRFTGMGARHASAASALTAYAAVLREENAVYSAAVDELRQLAISLPTPAVIRDALSAQSRAIAAFMAVQRAGQAAAASLTGGSSGSKRDDDVPWWNPKFWQPHDDTHTRDLPVDERALDDSAFDATDVNQGNLNDCFALSPVISLLATDAGDEFVKKHIRWDDDRDGYLVTLYDNGTPREVFVDKVFGTGVKGQSDDPSVASLYEAALAQAYGVDYLNNGFAADAMAKITGTAVHTTDGWPWSPSRADARTALENGGQVVIDSPRFGDNTINTVVRDASGNESRVDVTLVNQHVYSVVQMDKDGGMWVRNPWGKADSAGAVDIYLSPDQAWGYFGTMTYTNVTE